MSKSVLVFAFLAFSLNAQAPEAVNVAQEPSHHKIFENSYVCVFRVTIGANQSSLLHRHELDYTYVSLGPADIINAVQGKPEIHPKLVDGQVGYAKGGFAHVATAVGIPFNNVTIELLHPQGEPRNFCDKVVDGPVLDCSADTSNIPSDSPIRALARGGGLGPRRVLQTDEIYVTSFSISLKTTYGQDVPTPHLLVAVSDLQIGIQDEPLKSLQSGEILWLSPGRKIRILTPGGDKPTRFLMIRFKDAEASAKP